MKHPRIETHSAKANENIFLGLMAIGSAAILGACWLIHIALLYDRPQSLPAIDGKQGGEILKSVAHPSAVPAPF
jgi:hypothetical protein